MGLPTGHIKVFLPSADEREPALPTFGPDGPTLDDALPRPTIRTYAPRQFDAVALELTVDFVIRGWTCFGLGARRLTPAHRPRALRRRTPP
jgi:NADPH-dependent ferric siderophore reductase